MQRIARWGDGWMMLAHPVGPAAEAAFRKLRTYAAAFVALGAKLAFAER